MSATSCDVAVSQNGISDFPESSHMDSTAKSYQHALFQHLPTPNPHANYTGATSPQYMDAQTEGTYGCSSSRFSDINKKRHLCDSDMTNTLEYDLSARHVRQRASPIGLHSHLNDAIIGHHQETGSLTSHTRGIPNTATHVYRNTRKTRAAPDALARRARKRCSTTNSQCGSCHTVNIGVGQPPFNTNEDASPVYEDLRDCTYRCRYCKAAFWHDERLKGHHFYNGQPEYHLCCRGGKILMNPEPDPPEYIEDLLADANFMHNIKAYNQMFAMTSFEATIDNTINQGRGPYVFKVSGQIYHWIGSLCPAGDDDPCFLQLYIYETQNEVQNKMNHFEGSDRAALNPEIVQGLIQFLDDHNELVQMFRTA